MENSGNPKAFGNGRFTFSSSGEFNAPYKFENLLKLIVLGAGAGVIASVTFISVKVMRDAINSFPQGTQGDPRLFCALVAAFVIITTAVVTFLVAGFTVKHIGSGFRCSYASNDEKMVLNYGKTEFTIFYQDVDLVEFSPRSFFNKINGYDVQIRENGKILEFSIVSDSYISEKSTPFFIIKRQMERLRTATIDPDDENRTEREIALNIGSGRAISQAEIERARNKKASVYDRLNDLIGAEDAPSIEESESSDNIGEYVSPYEGKVSPTSEGFAGDMPKASKRFENPNHEFVVREGDTRERDLYEVMKMGSFYVMPDKKVFVVSQILWIAVGLVAGFIPAFIVNYYVGLYFLNVAMILFLAIEAAAAVWFFLHGLSHQHGREYKYRADGRSFKITSRGKPEENILYSEVTGVTYTPKKLFGKPYALNVSIVTNHITLNYRYMYPRFGRELKESELPFEIIKENIRDE